MAGVPTYQSRIQLSKDDISSAFESLPSRVLSQDQIQNILELHRKEWKLGVISSSRFANLLGEILPLRKVRLEFPNRPIPRMVWGAFSIFELFQ
jgi:hypothetical protein